MTTDDGSPTKREIEVALLLAKGATRRQIAKDLHVTLNTVNTHCARLMRRVGVHTAAALVGWLYDNGHATPAEVDVRDTEIARLKRTLAGLDKRNRELQDKLIKAQEALRSYEMGSRDGWPSPPRQGRL